MPEKLALQQRFRDGGTIDLDQFPRRARTPGVNDIGDDFLADAAFAGDQDAAFRGGHQGDIAKERLHERAGRDDVGGQLLAGVELERGAPRQSGGLADRGEQFVQIYRFGKIIDSPVAHGADGVADIGIGGDQKDGKGTVFLARLAQSVQAGESRHADVGDHHVYLLFAQDFQGALAGGNGHRLEPLGGQERIEQTALAGVVIHDQEPGRAGAGLGRGEGHGVHSLILSLTWEMRKRAPPDSLGRH